MNDLNEIFAKKLNQLGIKKQVEAAMVCEAFNKAVIEVFGKKGQDNVRAISFREDTLKVGVTSSSWASEINLRQLEIKGRFSRIRYEVLSSEDFNQDFSR